MENKVFLDDKIKNDVVYLGKLFSVSERSLRDELVVYYKKEIDLVPYHIGWMLVSNRTEVRRVADEFVVSALKQAYSKFVFEYGLKSGWR